MCNFKICIYKKKQHVCMCVCGHEFILVPHYPFKLRGGTGVREKE